MIFDTQLKSAPKLNMGKLNRYTYCLPDGDGEDEGWMSKVIRK